MIIALLAALFSYIFKLSNGVAFSTNTRFLLSCVGIFLVVGMTSLAVRNKSLMTFSQSARMKAFVAFIATGIIASITKTASVLFNAKIFSFVWVTLRARRFNMPIPTTHVFGMCNWLKVRRVNAFRSTTQVIQFKTTRNFSDQQLIGGNMCTHHTSLKPEIAIAFVGNGSRPKPTVILLDNFLKKSINRFYDNYIISRSPIWN